MSTLRNAINNEMKWTKTENGADALNTTGTKRLDFFAQSGSMRNIDVVDKVALFDDAWAEDARDTLVLLFHTRNIRGGYGERDTFNQLIAHLGDKAPETVEKNLWAILEFGRAKDLYSLIGTGAENAMWKFMKEQFYLDYENMKAGKGISLLAKWIALPDSKSEATKALGKKTARELGFNFKDERKFKTMTREMRAYLDIPEAKMATGRWGEIEYAKCASRFLLSNRKAFEKHDKERWGEYLASVNKGEANMNMNTVNPCDIFNKVYHGEKGKELDTMWKALPNLCDKDALVITDTSGSMWWDDNKSGNMYPGAVAWSIAAYYAERNKGALHKLFMTFDDHPEFVELQGDTLESYIRTFKTHARYGSTNMQAAFELLLDTCIKGNVKPEDMPEALIIVSDMQINCVKGIDSDGRITIFNAMKKKFEAAGYKLPQVVFWNVAVRKPTFLASKDDNGASLVSGYSVNILKNVFDSIGTTPYELMRAVIDQPVYEKITL